jgi:gamma-glutamylcyclotransferase (GGCT)/AIG2-like uncharacterized protein YtfP
MNKGILLFVYGTMKMKFRNYPRLYEGGAVYIGNARTRERFQLWISDRKHAPLAIRDDNGFPIEGELYAINEKYVENVIDIFEGHPKLYQRQLIKIENCNLEVWMYVYLHEPDSESRLCHLYDGAFRYVTDLQ